MTEPVVRMLWERLDPATVLADRFGFDGRAEAVSRLTRLLRDGYGLDALSCERIVMSDQNLLAWVRTDVGGLVVKACVRQPMFDRLRVVAETVATLGDGGLPVAPPLRASDGAARVLADGARPLSVVVLPEVTGDLLDVTDPTALRATGETLARVHERLAAVDVELPPAPGALGPAPGGTGPRPALPVAPHAREAAPRAAARLDALTAELGDLDVSPSLVHGDVRGANVLASGGRVTALLDYDSLHLGHRVLDLAGGIVKMATRFHTWDPPPPGAGDHLLAGYRAAAEPTASEEAWLEATILAQGLWQIPPGPDPAGWAAAVESWVGR